MLESVKISRRQSEIRQTLAGLVGKTEPTEDETRQMEQLDTEYRSNETRYRGALIAEDEERREAKDDLETRSDKEYAELVDKFEMRQVALHLDEGKALDGPTAEIVQELRSQGGYQGCPVPLMALERRAGETVASGTPAPSNVRPIIDRLFPDSVAARMGAQMVNIAFGTETYPVTSSSITAGWATTETGDVSGPTVFSTTGRELSPDQTLGIQVELTRKSMRQSGPGLEQAVRRDLNGAVAKAMDRAVFSGAGSSGEPLGIITGQSTYGISQTDTDAAPTWAAFRGAVRDFLKNSAASSPAMVRLLTRPEIYDAMDDTLITNTAVSEWDRLLANIPAANIALSADVLEPISPPMCSGVLTTVVNGVAPIFVGMWGAVDLIRDPYTKAKSGALLLTALATMDVNISRADQIQLLAGLDYSGYVD